MRGGILLTPALRKDWLIESRGRSRIVQANGPIPLDPPSPPPNGRWGGGIEDVLG